jgi:hypothetical protein
MFIGDRLKAIRESKGMSQGDIEKRTGLLRCYISRVENGHTFISQTPRCGVSEPAGDWVCPGPTNIDKPTPHSINDKKSLRMKGSLKLNARDMQTLVAVGQVLINAITGHLESASHQFRNLPLALFIRCDK